MFNHDRPSRSPVVENLITKWNFAMVIRGQASLSPSSDRDVTSFFAKASVIEQLDLHHLRTIRRINYQAMR
jgi:hypothetical protein